MADPTDPNTTKDQTSEGGAPEAEMSLEQLDSMILSEAPDFADVLKDVHSIPSDGSIDLEVVDTGELFPSEDNPWREPIGFRKFLVTILPFLPGLWDFQDVFFTKLHLKRTQLRNQFQGFGPRLVQGTKSGAKASVEYSKNRLGAFKALSRGMKIVAVVLTLSGVFTVAFVYRSMTRGVLPGDQEFLIASLEEWAVQTYKYDADSDMDSFYDSPRTIQNIMALPKMIVNLQASPSSGPNPMAAMEFFLEGLSPEAIVEVKDRESEIRDLFQRTLEDMTFGELSSAEGKQQLTERLRVALNTYLTKGKIRRVFIKEMVIKP